MFVFILLIPITLIAVFIYAMYASLVKPFTESDREWYEHEKEWAEYLKREEAKKMEGVK